MLLHLALLIVVPFLISFIHKKLKNDRENAEAKKVELMFELVGLFDAGRCLSAMMPDFRDLLLCAELSSANCPNPLILAVLMGDLETVEKLLEKNMHKQTEVFGVSVDGKAFSEMSPLWVASASGHLKIVKLLYEHNYDVNQSAEMKSNCGKAIDGISPLCAASCAGHFEICEFLIAKEAVVDHRTDNGLSPLLCACICWNFRIAKLLLENCADIGGLNELRRAPHYLLPTLLAFSHFVKSADSLQNAGANKILSVLQKTVEEAKELCGIGQENAIGQFGNKLRSVDFILFTQN